MTEQKQITTNLKGYINLAKTGHYPLFFSEWMPDNKDIQRVSFQFANKNVKDTFHKLSRHRSTERKKIALMSMNKSERDSFVNSFFKVVEHNLLKEMTSLQ